MFDKIGSISSRLSFFAKETNGTDLSKGIQTVGIENNLNVLNKWIEEFSVKKEYKGVGNYEQR